MKDDKVKSARILLVSSNFPPMIGGSGVVYEALAEDLTDSFNVLAARFNYRTLKEFEGWKGQDLGSPFTIKRLKLLRSPLAAAAQWRPIRLVSEALTALWVFAWVFVLKFRHRINVLCIGELDAGAWLRLVGRLLRLKIVFYVHGDELSEAAVNPAAQTRRKRSLSRSDCVFAVSSFAHDLLINSYGVSVDKAVLLQNGVNLKRFYPRTKDVDLTRKFKLENRRVLVTICRLVERKGIDRTIEALPRILESVPNIVYLIVGDGSYRKELEALSVKTGVQDHVIFTGDIPHSEVPDYYALGDVFCMPNRQMPSGENEGFGLVYLEANAVGLPAIAGKAGGVVDAVHDNKNGLNVDGDQAEQIAAAVIELMNNDEKYLRLKEGGLKMVEENSWHRKAEEFQHKCNELVY